MKATDTMSKRLSDEDVERIASRVAELSKPAWISIPPWQHHIIIQPSTYPYGVPMTPQYGYPWRVTC